MHASLRTYRIGSGSVDAVMRRVDRDFAEALSQEPGFVAYHAIDTGNDMVMTVSLFHDREQAEASNELAAQWIAEELRYWSSSGASATLTAPAYSRRAS